MGQLNTCYFTMFIAYWCAEQELYTLTQDEFTQLYTCPEGFHVYNLQHYRVVLVQIWCQPSRFWVVFWHRSTPTNQTPDLVKEISFGGWHQSQFLAFYGWEAMVDVYTQALVPEIRPTLAQAQTLRDLELLGTA